MQRIILRPGIVVALVSIPLPVGAPRLRRVVTAEINRVRLGVADHAVHGHDFVSQGIGGAVANALGLPAGLNVINDAGAAALHTVPAGGATGVQNNAAAQAHAVGAGILVAAVPVFVDRDNFTLSVTTEDGDLVRFDYEEEGAQRVP